MNIEIKKVYYADVPCGIQGDVIKVDDWGMMDFLKGKNITMQDVRAAMRAAHGKKLFVYEFRRLYEILEDGSIKGTPCDGRDAVEKDILEMRARRKAAKRAFW